MTGTDHTGEWTPQQYVLDAGWDFYCIIDTAVKGISEVDAEILTDEQQTELMEYCKGKAGVFEKGDRVKLSEKGRAWLNTRNPDRLGTVVTKPDRTGYVCVQWDGCSSSLYYSNVFIDFASQE